MRGLIKSALFAIARRTAEYTPFWALYRAMGRMYDHAAKERNFAAYGKAVPLGNEAGHSDVGGSMIGSPPIAYDVGMNNGDDTEYYLKKGLRVIGIEANPALCEMCAQRFHVEVESGQLRIVNCAVAESEGLVTFYVHGTEHVLSTLVEPSERREEWEAIQVPARRLSSIVGESGDAYYIKVDVENYDHIVLYDLLTAGITPRYISAESHQIDVFCLLVSMGYTRFKLVDGVSVSTEFRRHRISTVDGRQETHAFKYHSAGPFGEDIPGPWIGKSELLSKLMRDGLGWKDVHAMR